MKQQGKLITFEGVDGCGKTTQLALEAKHLRERGFRVTATRQPAGTPVGEQIRDIVSKSSPGTLTPMAELALMFAARTEHIERVVLPALRAGEIVLCDRFTDSSVAYQGYGRGLSTELIRSLERLLCYGVRPDLTVVLDVPLETGARRTGHRNQTARQQESRFEKEGMEFFDRVRRGYLEIAKQEPERVKVVDGSGSIAEVQGAVRRIIEGFLGREERGSAHGV